MTAGDMTVEFGGSDDGYDGDITVRLAAHQPGYATIVTGSANYNSGTDHTILHATADELDQLIAALQIVREEIDP